VALSHSPSIVTNGLVLCLDAANRKGYDKFENLMTSSQLGNTILNDGGAVTLTTDTTIASPFGGSDGVLKCVHTTQTPGYFRRGQNMSLTAGVTYTFSFYFKNGTVSNPYGQNPINFGILASTYSPTFEEPSQSLNTNIDVGNGWYRQVFTFTPTYTQTYQVDFSQTVNQTPIGTYYLYGFQLERGSSVTDYYATTSTAKNRGTIWSDLSGRGNTGTLTNGVGYGNSNNGSFVFDGANDYVPTSTLSNQFLTTGFTVSVWLYYIPTTTNDNLISWGGGAFNGTSYTWEIRLRGNNGNIEFSPGIGPGGTGIPNRLQYISPSGWGLRIMCIDVTFVANGVATLYENGVSRATRDYTGIGVSSQTRAIDVGRGSDTYFPGNIYSVKVYDRVLSAAEIQQNFNALRGRFGI
jgi:hypothetical protein